MNKKAVEKMISVWWFFVLFVIAMGIVLGVMVYYSSETVVKKVEAESLNQRVFDCITDKGYLNKKVFESFDVLQACGLNPEVFGKGSLFYIKVSAYDKTGLINEKAYGDFSIDKNCKVVEKVSTRRFPECFSKNITVLDNNDKEIKLFVLTASNQEGERVSSI